MKGVRTAAALVEGEGGRHGRRGIFWVVGLLCVWRGPVVMQTGHNCQSSSRQTLPYTQKLCFLPSASCTSISQKKERKEKSKLELGPVTPFPGTVQSDFRAIKNSRSMAENSSCLLSAESTPITARAAAAAATRASFLLPPTYFPDK